MNDRGTFFEEALEKGDTNLLKRAIDALKLGELAERFTPEDADTQDLVLTLLSDRRAAMLLRRIPAGVAADILTRIGRSRAAHILARMPVDDRVDVLENMPEEEHLPLIDSLPPAAKISLDRALSYPEHSAGRTMVDQVVRLTPPMTVAEALEAIRTAKDHVDTLLEAYVVDETGKLLGLIALTELVTSPPGDLIGDRMTKEPIRVHPEVDREEVVSILNRYDFLAVPVVDEADRLLGIVTVDDVMDVMVEESTMDVLQLGGIDAQELVDDPYLNLEMSRVIRSRVAWLTLLFATETLTGTVLRHFEVELHKQVQLAFFIPLLIGTGGNSGSQTVTAVIRGLALGEIRPGDATRVLAREACTGASMGFILGIVAFLWTSLFWGMPPAISATVAVTIFVICAWSNSVGAMIPILATKFSIDPTVMSAPLISTLVDATGLFIYFSIAHFILF